MSYSGYSGGTASLNPYSNSAGYGYSSAVTLASTLEAEEIRAAKRRESRRSSGSQGGRKSGSYERRGSTAEGYNWHAPSSRLSDETSDRRRSKSMERNSAHRRRRSHDSRRSSVGQHAESMERSVSSPRHGNSRRSSATHTYTSDLRSMRRPSADKAVSEFRANHRRSQGDVRRASKITSRLGINPVSMQRTAPPTPTNCAYTSDKEQPTPAPGYKQRGGFLRGCFGF